MRGKDLVKENEEEKLLLLGQGLFEVREVQDLQEMQGQIS
jgi:hypothetical protein